MDVWLADQLNEAVELYRQECLTAFRQKAIAMILSEPGKAHFPGEKRKELKKLSVEDIYSMLMRME